ncbi:MAG: hypothetical protein H6705_13895 [Myxococcales bacterium]|nr:hypothetical protein [Myxococcales bacterium]
MRRALVAALALAAPARAADTSGRPEALILTTAFGFYEGVAISILLDDHDLLPSGDDGLVAASALTLATTGLGFGLGWWVTEEYGVNQAQAGLFTSGFFWTTLNGLSGGLGVGLDSGDDLLINSLVSGWTGQALGVLLAANVDRTAGQVSLMNTVATWTGAEVALWQGVFGVEAGSSYFTWSTLAADVGLLVGPIWRARPRHQPLAGAAARPRRLHRRARRAGGAVHAVGAGGGPARVVPLGGRDRDPDRDRRRVAPDA